MITFIIDSRVRELVHGFLPDNVEVEVIDPEDGQIGSDCLSDRPVLAAIALAGHADELGH